MPTLNERQQHDLDLFHKWKQSKDPYDLADIMDSLHPLIQKEVSRASGTIPESALSSEAKHWALKAIDSYDPSKGAALGTHVQNNLLKIRRLNSTYSNSARLPENLHYEHSSYTDALQNLTDRLNREPTDDEMAEELSWSPRKVVRFRNSLYADHFESVSDQPGDASDFNWGAVELKYIKRNLSPQEVTLFENSGLSNPALAEKMGVNVNRLNYLKTKLRAKISKLQNEFRGH